MRKARLIMLFGASAMMAIPSHAQTKVSTVPISRDILVLRLVVGQAAPATVVSLNGGLIRLGIRNGPTLGLIPALRGSGIGVTVMDILTNDATEGETARQLAKVDVTLGSSTRYDDARFSLEIGLTEIKPPARGGTAELANPCTMCCVTCGDLTACACAVEMECGKCCCPAGGCGCDIEGRPSAATSVGCAGTNVRRQLK